MYIYNVANLTFFSRIRLQKSCPNSYTCHMFVCIASFTTICHWATNVTTMWAPWFQYHRLRQTRILIYENVIGCPEWFIKDNLGSDYRVDPIFVTPSDANFTMVGRRRVYFICTHVKRTRLLGPIAETYQYVVSGIKKQRIGRLPEPRDCFIAPEYELDQEERERADCLGISAQMRQGTRRNWEYLLSDVELAGLEAYKCFTSVKVRLMGWGPLYLATCFAGIIS